MFVYTDTDSNFKDRTVTKIVYTDTDSNFKDRTVTMIVYTDTDSNFKDRTVTIILYTDTDSNFKDRTVTKIVCTDTDSNFKDRIVTMIVYQPRQAKGTVLSADGATADELEREHPLSLDRVRGRSAGNFENFDCRRCTLRPFRKECNG